MSERVPSFSSKVGLILATAGSAVGLGNIWKFPYIAGENGGGAFLLIYLLCVVLFGLPLLMTELYIGKRSGKSAYGAFRALRENNRWQWLSWLCMLTAILVMGFYFVVTGWCFHYLIAAVGHVFRDANAVTLTEHFQSITSNLPAMFGYTILAVVLTAVVLWFDVNKGIERLSKILMPLLLIMLFIMAGRVLMLDGSNAGMSFFFQADFSKITPQVILAAMGQCFFSLSIGLGALITYGAYMPKSQSISATSIQVVFLDTAVAVLAGVIIFPAVFAFGVDPAEGPQLVFVVLPEIFEQMSFSWLSSILFFSLLCIAAVTSTISLMEVAVAFVCDASSRSKRPLNRHQSVLLVVGIVILMAGLCILWPYVFGWFDTISSCWLMPLNAFAMSLFVGWFLPKEDIMREFGKQRGWKHQFAFVYVQIIRYLIPLAILAIFLNGLGIW